MKKNLVQGAEILAICERLALTPAQLADRIPMKAETMRKVVKGYQPASERMMQQIRNVEQLMRLEQDERAVGPSGGASPYALMTLETLQQNFAEVAGQLRQALPDRRHVLANLRAMLTELERRAAPERTVARGPLTEAQRIALGASEKLDREKGAAGK